MPYGLSDTGFMPKRLDAILEEKNEAVKAVLGSDLNLDPSSPDGQINGMLSVMDYELWGLLEQVYNTFNPAGARGVALDNLVALNGIQRLAASASLVSLTVTGTDGTVVPNETTVQDTSGQVWEIYQGGTIASGTLTALARSVDLGPVAAGANTITTLVTPIFGVSAVTNALAAVSGREEETDGQLRTRRTASIAFPSQSMVDSIFSQVANTEGVSRTRVIENDTPNTLVTGQTPHSFQVVVVGGTAADIARAIFDRKPAGIEAYGTTVESVVDSQGLPHDIGFTRPTEKPVFIRVDLTTFATFPADGDDAIKQAIVDYAAGILIAGAEINLGDDVIYTRLFTPINTVQGHQVDELYISFTDPAGPGDTSNLAIAVDEIATFDIINIVVNA